MAGHAQSNPIVARIRELWARANGGDVDYPFCARGDNIDPDDREAVDQNLLRIFEDEARVHPVGTDIDYIIRVLIYG